MEDMAKTPVSQPEVKAAKKDSKDKKSSENSLGRYFKELKGEFKKIIWPNGKQLSRETVTVIVLSLLVGVIIVGIDWVFAFGYNHLVTLIQGLFS
jgi:preprotein translocase subunit SecE